MGQINVLSTVYSTLASGSSLTAKLSTYSGSPAIFTTEPVPNDAVMPYIVITDSVAQTPQDTKLTRGREVWMDIRCYTKSNGSVANVDSIAELVRELLHRKTLSGIGFSSIVTTVDGYIVANEEYAYGRILTLKILLEEN
jgi:hypothetical protein